MHFRLTPLSRFKHLQYLTVSTRFLLTLSKTSFECFLSTKKVHIKYAPFYDKAKLS